MRICLVNSFYYPNIIGGAELSVLKLAEQLKKEGHQVYVICTSDKESIDIINGIEVHRLKINNIYNPIDKLEYHKKISKSRNILYSVINTYNIFNYRMLNDKLKKIQPDILHINNIDGISIVIWSVAKKMNIKIVQTLRDYSLLKCGKGILNKIRNPIYKLLSNNVDCITAPSKYTINSFIDNDYFKSSKKKVIYNAIDFSDEIVIKSLNQKIIRSKHNENIRFVFLGRLDEGKGIKYLVDTFRKISDNHIELVIAGKGEYEEYIKGVAKIDKRIKYKGFMNETGIEELLYNSDVLIIPSLWEEPFGRVIIEAYKFAMPVIGSNIGGIPEIINDKTGILVEKGSESELQQAIKYFSNRENIDKYIVNCSNEIKKYDIKIQSKEFTKLYESIIFKQ